MMLFVLNVKKNLDTDIIVSFIKDVFSLDDSEVDFLTGDKVSVEARYDCVLRESNVEFVSQISFYVLESECYKSEVYNSLQLALAFSEKINDEVLVDDYSNDPTRWLLVNKDRQIFIVHELFDDENDFTVDRNSLYPISIEKCLQVLPSKNYLEIPQEDRPAFYNQDDQWRML